MQTRALNGVPTPTGSLLARIGTVVFLGALAAFYTLLARVESPPTGRGRAARIAGWLACGLGLFVPAITSDVSRTLHLVSVVVAFVPALVAAVFGVAICWKNERVGLGARAGALGTAVAGGMDGLLYGYVYAAPPLGLVPSSPVVRQVVQLSLPLLQRVATVALVGWVVAVAFAALSDKQAPR